MEFPHGQGNTLSLPFGILAGIVTVVNKKKWGIFENEELLIKRQKGKTSKIIVHFQILNSSHLLRNTFKFILHPFSSTSEVVRSLPGMRKHWHKVSLEQKELKKLENSGQHSNQQALMIGD